MTPLRARLHGWYRHVLCGLGQHEHVTHTQAATAATGDTLAQPALLRQRCLHCGVLTAGWPQDGPRYTVTQPGDRARMTLHNPRLTRCRCAKCGQAWLARRKRTKVTPIKRTA